MPPKHVVIELDQSCQVMYDTDASETRTRLSSTQALHCLHCGEKFPFPLGMVDWVMGVMKAFGNAHKYCRQRDLSPLPKPLCEGMVQKGGHNDPPTTPRPATPPPPQYPRSASGRLGGAA